MRAWGWGEDYSGVGVGFIEGYRAGKLRQPRARKTGKRHRTEGKFSSMGQAESKLSRDIMDELRLEGWFCFKVHGSETMMAGLPDVIVCAEGKFIGLETKMPAKRTNTSLKQDHVRDKIRTAGGICEVVCSKAEAVRVVRAALGKS